MDDGFAKSVEGFQLAAFGGHRRVNRRATRIQIRRDALLLGWRCISPRNCFKFLRSQVRDSRTPNNSINEASMFEVVEPVVEEAGRGFLKWTNPIDCILKIAGIKLSSPSCAAPNIAALVDNQVADSQKEFLLFPW